MLGGGVITLRVLALAGVAGRTALFGGWSKGVEVLSCSGVAGASSAEPQPAAGDSSARGVRASSASSAS